MANKVRFGHNYSNPKIDGKVNHHQISDLLFHLFGDDYTDYYRPLNLTHCQGAKRSNDEQFKP